MENTKSKIALENIIDELQSISIDCKWFLSSDRLSELLEIRKEDYYRHLYSFKISRYQFNFSNGFHEVDGDVLIEFLSYILKEDNIADYFSNAGIYFDERSLFELKEQFKGTLEFYIENHTLDADLLKMLISASIEFDDAFDSYFDSKFDPEILIERSIEEYVSLRKIPLEHGADIFLKDYLFTLLNTRILNLRFLTTEFRDTSYFKIYGKQKPKKKVLKKKRISKELLDLLDFFGLDEESGQAELKKKFKELIKIYHPDLNKNGLEMTKKIIENYNKLNLLLPAV